MNKFFTLALILTSTLSYSQTNFKEEIKRLPIDQQRGCDTLENTKLEGFVLGELQIAIELDSVKSNGKNFVADENGTWILDGNRLKITVTGENVRGEQKLHDKAQIMEFEIMREGTDYVLTVIADRGASDGKTTKLRLTKK